MVLSIHSSFSAGAGFILFIMVAVTALIALFSAAGSAKVKTDSCADCHTVHAMQDENGKNSRGLYASRLTEACESCHADANSHTLAKIGKNMVPIVKNGQEPEAPLAGGNFYYGSGQLHFIKAGGSCTACHRDVRHHSDKHGYRFLGSDIGGVGDPQYEYGNGHNIYKSGDLYCSACHGEFCGLANQKNNGFWVRHPTNTPIPRKGEYAGYIHRKDVPVSYPDPDNPDRNSARVMCLSCHRPHGTPNPYLLRWDYSTMVAGGGRNNSGCFACHSHKDEPKGGV